MLWPRSMTSPKGSWMRPARRGLLLLSLVPLTGCGTTLVATVEPVCTPEVLRDVCVSKDDKLTEPTAQAIEGNNLALRKLCKRESLCKTAPKAKTPVAASSAAKAGG